MMVPNFIPISEQAGGGYGYTANVTATQVTLYRFLVVFCFSIHPSVCHTHATSHNVWIHMSGFGMLVTVSQCYILL